MPLIVRILALLVSSIVIFRRRLIFNVAAFDLGIFPTPLWQTIGLPAIPQGTGPNCSGLPGTPPCTPDDLVKDLQKREPIYLPYTSPSYSNVGFALLGMIIDAATNKSYIDNIQDNVFDTVNMNSSSFNGFVKSFSENGFVPVGETTWNVTLGVFERYVNFSLQCRHS